MQLMLIWRRTPQTSTVATMLSASSMRTMRPGMPRHMVGTFDSGLLAAMSRAAPIAAWPSARPPSLAGTCAWVSTVKPASRNAASDAFEQDAVLEQPPESATVSKRALGLCACHESRRIVSTSACARPLWKRSAMSLAGSAIRQIAEESRPTSATDRGAGDFALLRA